MWHALISRSTLSVLMLTFPWMASGAVPSHVRPADDRTIIQAIAAVRKEARVADNKPIVLVPVYEAGCPSCTKMYRKGDALLDSCQQPSYQLIYMAPVYRRAQWASLNRMNAYPVRTVADVGMACSEAIGSSAQSPKVVVVWGSSYRIVDYSLEAMCAAMRDLRK